jgi:predicted nucleotidyltransferase component of viral defense system
MITPQVRAQVDLLLQTIPIIAQEEIFALNGGTAINLFIRDMPRLSVDIDLTYLPIDDRETAFRNISDGLARIKQNLIKSIKGITVTTVASGEGHDIKLHCQLENAQIKIEVNTIKRGHIHPTRILTISDSVQQEFEKFASMQIISNPELFGGKICAALDRQHPRDLFDIKLLFENEGFSEDIKNGFIVSLLSHERPINELISPNLIDHRGNFETQFAGMARIPFTYEDFEQARDGLVNEIHSKLTNEDRKFILSFKQGNPDWNIFPITILKDLPAVKWKLQNIQKLIKNNPEKHAKMLTSLTKIFNNNEISGK